MVRKARKKPAEIKFIHYTGNNKQELNEWEDK